MGIAICPSQIETRGSFATITDGKCGLIDCLAFLFHEETGACWSVEVGGVLFIAAFCGRCTTR